MLEYMTFTEVFHLEEKYELYPPQVQEALRHPPVCSEHPDGRLGLFYVYLYRGQVAWYHNGKAKMLEPAPVRLRAMILTYLGCIYAIGVNGFVYSYDYENYTVGMKGWYILRALKDIMGSCVGFDHDSKGYLRIICANGDHCRFDGVTPSPPQRPPPIQWLLSQVPQPFG